MDTTKLLTLLALAITLCCIGGPVLVVGGLALNVWPVEIAGLVMLGVVVVGSIAANVLRGRAVRA